MLQNKSMDGASVNDLDALVQHLGSQSDELLESLLQDQEYSGILLQQYNMLFEARRELATQIREDNFGQTSLFDILIAYDNIDTEFQNLSQYWKRTNSTILEKQRRCTQILSKIRSLQQQSRGKK